MDHQKIFYTNLFVIDDFIPTATNAEKERIEGMKKYISDLWSKRDYDDNWQTKSANLHKQKEFNFRIIRHKKKHALLQRIFKNFKKN